MREVKFRGKFEDQWWYATANDEDDMGEWEHFWALVNRKTVSQWTGCVDQQGKDIYEDDIVEYLENTGWGLIKKTVTIDDMRNLPDFTCSKWEKVIGNIYEDTELIVKEQEYGK